MVTSPTPNREQFWVHKLLNHWTKRAASLGYSQSEHKTDHSLSPSDQLNSLPTSRLLGAVSWRRNNELYGIGCSCELAGYSAILCNSKFHRRVHKILPIDLLLNEFNSIWAFIPLLCRSILILRSHLRVRLSFGLSGEISINYSISLCVLRAPPILSSGNLFTLRITCEEHNVQSSCFRYFLPFRFMHFLQKFVID
jgi:hypothetical protein